MKKIFRLALLGMLLIGLVVTGKVKVMTGKVKVMTDKEMYKAFVKIESTKVKAKYKFYKAIAITLLTGLMFIGLEIYKHNATSKCIGFYNPMVPADHRLDGFRAVGEATAKIDRQSENCLQ